MLFTLYQSSAIIRQLFRIALISIYLCKLNIELHGKPAKWINSMPEAIYANQETQRIKVSWKTKDKNKVIDSDLGLILSLTLDLFWNKL